eukprot:10005170-Karenia_brevis.AAC.1
MRAPASRGSGWLVRVFGKKGDGMGHCYKLLHEYLQETAGVCREALGSESQTILEPPGTSSTSVERGSAE